MSIEQFLTVALIVLLIASVVSDAFISRIQSCLDFFYSLQFIYSESQKSLVQLCSIRISIGLVNTEYSISNSLHEVTTKTRV